MERGLPRGLRELSGPGALVVVATLASPLAIGSVHLSAKLALVGLLLVAFLWTARRRMATEEPFRVGWIGAGLMMLLAWTVVQWIPLPQVLLETLAPRSWHARVETARALGIDPPSAAPLSLDGPRTAAAWLTLLIPTLAYFTVANLRGAHQRRRLVEAVAVAGLMVLAVGVVQGLVGAPRIYGLYEPTAGITDQLLRTSFVNPNHAGALLVLGACISLGLWSDLDAHEPSRAPLPLLAFLALSVGVLATMSRGNAVAWAIGCLLIAAFRLRSWPAERRPRWLRGWLAPLGLLLVVAVPTGLGLLLIGSTDWLRELATLGDASHYAAQRAHPTFWRIGVDILAEHPWVGVGHGAFEAAASLEMQRWQTGFAHHSHNLFLQGLADWGVPVALVGGGLVAVGSASVLRRTIRRGDALAVGSAVGLVALVVQNQFDFSLWIPGVALPAGVLAGSLALESTRRRPPIPRWRAHTRWVATVATSLACTGLMASDALRHSPTALAESWRQDLERGEAPATETALMRHPHDFQLHALGALAAEPGGDRGKALRLADRAVALAPLWPDGRLIRARLRLASGDARGGARDLIHVWRQGRPFVDRAHDEALRHLSDREFLEAYLGADPQLALSAANRLRQQGHGAAAAHVLSWAIERFPDEVALHEMLGYHWSLHPNRWEDLAALATRTLARGAGEEDPELGRRLKRAGYFLDGMYFKARGRHREAYHVFLEAAQLEPERAVQPLVEAAYASVEMERPDRLVRILARIRETGSVDSRWVRARIHHLESRAAEYRGEYEEALKAAQAAIRERPRSPDYHDHLAALFETVGRHRAARRAHQRADLLREEPHLDPSRWMNPITEADSDATESAHHPRSAEPGSVP